MILIPFGEVREDRVEISRKYNLIEKCGGIWRLTAKAKKHYDPDSYVYYLRGKIEKPSRLGVSVEQQIKSSGAQKLIEEILTL